MDGFVCHSVRYNLLCQFRYPPKPLNQPATFDKPTIQKYKNTKNIDYLDVAFKGQHFQTDKKLATKVYFKLTDTHMLLHHYLHQCVKSQMERFYRICKYNKQDAPVLTLTVLVTTIDALGHFETG